MSPHDFIARVRGEYSEMPGLRLTIWQASRLWQLDQVTCQDVMDALVTERFLFRTADGAYIMGPSRPPVAKIARSAVSPERRPQ